MSEAAAQLIAAFRDLPDDDRSAVRDAINETFADKESGPDAEFEALLARRVAEIRQGKVVGAPAEELMDRLRRKYQK